MPSLFHKIIKRRNLELNDKFDYTGLWTSGELDKPVSP